MKAKLSQIFLVFSIVILIMTIVWLVYPSPYRVCHLVLTGMGRAKIYPAVAKFKPYKGKTMGGMALMNAVVKEQIASFTEKQEPYCYLSLGAELSGTADAFLTKGEAIVNCFNAMKLNAMLVGNIDFTFGKERLAELAKLAKFNFIASNVFNDGTKNTPDYLKSELIIETPHDLMCCQ